MVRVVAADGAVGMVFAVAVAGLGAAGLAVAVAGVGVAGPGVATEDEATGPVSLAGSALKETG